VKATPRAYELIQRWEALRLGAYLDFSGVPTIGWGTTRYPDGRRVRLGDICTREQADEWLRIHVEEECEKPLNEALESPVNEQMFDALVSWTYNVGQGSARRSTLIRLLNEGNYLAAVEEFDRWNRDDGVVVPGLSNRRNAEQDLFRQGINTAIAAARDMGFLA
jgi:lysozyme